VSKFPTKAKILAAMPDAGDVRFQSAGDFRLQSADETAASKTRIRAVNNDARCLTPAALRYPEAAAYIGICVGTLRNWVSEGKGPISVILGKRGRRFRVSDLDAFLSSHLVSLNTETVQLQPRRRGRPAKSETAIRRRSWVGGA